MTTLMEEAPASGASASGSACAGPELMPKLTDNLSIDAQPGAEAASARLAVNGGEPGSKFHRIKLQLPRLALPLPPPPRYSLSAGLFGGLYRFLKSSGWNKYISASSWQRVRLACSSLSFSSFSFSFSSSCLCCLPLRQIERLN